jgi:hypothetical protein
LSLARQFGVTLFMPKNARKNLKKGSIPAATAERYQRP